VDDEPEAHDLNGTSDYFTRLQQRMKDEVLRIRMPDRHAKKTYDDALVPGLEIDHADLKKGIRVRSFRGVWRWVPDFTQLTADSDTLGEGMDLTRLPAEEHAGLLFSGYIRIPEPGDWTFHGKAGGKIILKIHRKLVLDGDYKYDGTEISTTVKLDRGLHPYRLYYKTAGGEPALDLQWEGPHVAKGPIHADALLVEVDQPPDF
ncbi:MAG: PA14 domain-containing protein, partial [Verrucomicrobiota bacterium]